MHSKYFDKWKRYFDNSLLSANQLHHLIGKKFGLTAAEYEEITGEKA